MNRRVPLGLAGLLLLALAPGCEPAGDAESREAPAPAAEAISAVAPAPVSADPDPPDGHRTAMEPVRINPDTAWFAGGCFWCMEPPFDALEGVHSTTSGFMGGWMENPSYADVTAGGTGHAEVVQVVFDPERVSYQALLDVFWVNVDPLDAGGQFCDRGEIYRSEIFARDQAQLEAAGASLRALEAAGRFDSPIVTRVTPSGPFFAAEDYHQGYYLKNPVRYRVYRTACGRDRRLRQIWGDQAP
jgi:peptide-methionine (S)-S-oxide reductase